VEFEAPPDPSILTTLCQALRERQVYILDSATRLTPEKLFQSFHLRERHGKPLIGERRQEVETLFLTTLSPAC
ncbi:MAG TPA: hypothetical protein VL137_15305, partial [Polyangiaceae bacterium]|nr:hypothetical protein [Polyangiaceae bacterium]